MKATRQQHTTWMISFIWRYHSRGLEYCSRPIVLLLLLLGRWSLAYICRCRGVAAV